MRYCNPRTKRISKVRRPISFNVDTIGKEVLCEEPKVSMCLVLLAFIYLSRDIDQTPCGRSINESVLTLHNKIIIIGTRFKRYVPFKVLNDIV